MFLILYLSNIIIFEKDLSSNRFSFFIRFHGIKMTELKWKKGCIHIHTPVSDDFGYENIQKPDSESPEEKEERINQMKEKYDLNRNITPREFLQKFIEKDYDFIVITDHHSFNWINDLRNELEILKVEDSNLKFTIFPGIEMSVGGYHLEIIFDPNITIEKLNQLIIKLQIDNIIGKSAKTLPWETSSTAFTPRWQNVHEIEDYFKKSPELKYLIGFPHIKIQTGVHSQSNQARTKIYKQVRAIYGMLPENITNYKTAIRNEMNFNRPVPLVQTSDYHGVDENKIVPTWIRFETMSIDSFRQSIYDPESRISLTEPSPIDYPYISSLTCPGIYFNETSLNFSPHINVIIGGRGSGKSSIIEMIFFVLKKIDKMWNSKNKVEKERARKILNKLNNLIRRNSSISIEIINFSKNYPIIKISRDFKYIESDELDDISINSLLNKDIIISHNGTQLAFALVLREFSLFCEIYFQNEFHIFTNNPKYPLQILELLFEQNNRLRTSQIKKKIGELNNEIRNIQTQLIGLYTIDGNLQVLDPFHLNNEINALKEKLNVLQDEFKISSSVEDKKIQETHSEWLKIQDKMNKNFKSISAFLEFASSFQQKVDKKGIKKVQIENFLEEQEKLLAAFDFNNKFLSINEDLSEFDGILKEFSKKNQDLIARNAQALKEIKKAWIVKDLKHSQEYEKFQKENKEKSQLRDEINRIEINIRNKTSEIEKNSIHISKIKELEEKLTNILIFYQELWKKIIKKRESGIKYLNHSLPSNQYGHLEFSYDFEWRYMDKLDEITDRINKNFLHNICKKISGRDFVQIIESEYKDLPKPEIFDEFMSLGLTQKTKKKLFQLYPSEEVPSNIRGLFDQNLFNIESSGLDEQIKIKVRKGSLLSDLNDVSPGEQHRNLLLLALINKNTPLIVDQPEDHLDFDIKNQLPDIIRSHRFKHQFLIVTHFQNIPVLSDVEKIFFLKEYFDSDTQKMKSEITFGAFESMVKHIIELEGGPKAILERKNRYAEFIKELKEEEI